MRIIVFMLIVFIIPITMNAQDQRQEQHHHHHHQMPASTSPDGFWTVKPIFHDGKFVSYEWSPRQTSRPGWHWQIFPIFKHGQVDQYTWILVPDSPKALVMPSPQM